MGGFNHQATIIWTWTKNIWTWNFWILELKSMLKSCVPHRCLAFHIAVLQRCMKNEKTKKYGQLWQLLVWLSKISDAIEEMQKKLLKTVVGLSGRNDPFECKCPFSSRSYQTQDQFGQYHIVFNYICFFVICFMSVLHFMSILILFLIFLFDHFKWQHLICVD